MLHAPEDGCVIIRLERKEAFVMANILIAEDDAAVR